MRWAFLILLLGGGAAAWAEERLLSRAGLAMPAEDEAATARALGMASAYVGLAQEPATLLANPAGLAWLKSAEVGLHHRSALLGSSQECILLGLPMESWGGMAAAFSYRDHGNFEGRDELGRLAAPYLASAFGWKMGWGRPWGRRAALGLGAAFNRLNLAGFTYDSLALDLGGLWKVWSALQAGASICNLGTDLAGSPRTSSLRLGLAWQEGGNLPHALILAAAWQFQPGAAQLFQVGMEQSLSGMAFLRAGYQLSDQDAALGGLGGFSAGLGLRLGAVRADYAYVPMGLLGSHHSLSLSYFFPAPGPSKDPKPPAAPATAKGGARVPNLATQVQAWSRHLRRYPRDAQAWWSLAQLYLRLDRKAWARYCFNQAWRLNSVNKIRK